MRPRRVLGYARVSSEEQARGSSLQDQQNAVHAYVVAQGLTVTRFFVEAESAVHEKIERREQIRSLMNDVRQGDLVVCDKLDRWSRDPEFTYGSIRQILERAAAFYAVGDRCDPSTRDGDTMLGVRVLVAREEHKRIRERMVGTRILLRDRGYYVEGLPPFGYRRGLPKGHKGPNKNVLVIEPHEADQLRRAFRLCISGHSLSKIAALVGLARHTLCRAFHKRVYLGEMKDSRGTWMKGRHEAIIDADTFSRVQAAISNRRLGGARPPDAVSETSDWILRDVAQCARCGARMSAVYAGPREARRYYYSCSKHCVPTRQGRTSGAFVNVRKVEAQAEPFVVARLQELREELAREPKPLTTKLPADDFAERRARLQRRRVRYLEAFADEHMTRDELREAMAKLDQQALQLDAEEQALKRPSPLAAPEVRRAALREVGTIAKAWRHARPEERRKIVGHLAVAARLLNGKPCQFVWRSPEELTR